MHTAPDSSQERLHNCCALHPDNTVVVVWRKGKKKQLLWIAPFAESDRSVYLLNFQLSRSAHSQVIISLFRGGGVCTLLPCACVHAHVCIWVRVSMQSDRMEFLPAHEEGVYTSLSALLSRRAPCRISTKYPQRLCTVPMSAPQGTVVRRVKGSSPRQPLWHMLEQREFSRPFSSGVIGTLI